jgi:hypothetical protein
MLAVAGPFVRRCFLVVGQNDAPRRSGSSAKSYPIFRGDDGSMSSGANMGRERPTLVITPSGSTITGRPN